jgi:hypothetical protein
MKEQETQRLNVSVSVGEGSQKESARVFRRILWVKAVDTRVMVTMQDVKPTEEEKESQI